MFCSATTLPGSVALPFVSSTGAQRSGEICGSTVPPWECSVQQLLSPEALPSPLSSRPERSAVERSAVQRSLPGNVLFSNYSPRKRCPPLCHLDRSAAQQRDLRFNGLSLGMFCSATTLPGSVALPFVISTGAQRSGEICGSTVSPWECSVQQLLSPEALPSPLSSRPERSAAERSAVQRSLPGNVLFSNYSPRKRCPPLCHLDRSAAQRRDLRFNGLSLGMFCSATTLPGSVALPFVISTGAQRSREICGSTVSPWECSVQQLPSPEALPSPLSSRPERSAVERSAVQRSLLGNALFSNYSPRKRCPPLCHLDRSAAQWRDLRFNGPSLGMFCSATTLSGSVALPFVISTGAQRSGEICGSTVPPWECSVQQLLSPEALPSPLSSRPERSAVERSAVQRSLPGNVLFSDYSLRKRCPPLCQLDRSAAQWRDLRFNGPSLGMFCSATTVPGSVALPFVISTGAQRSGEICGSAVAPWECSVQQLLSPEALPSPLSSRPERSAVERSAVQRSLPGNVLFSDYSLRKRCPPLCHLDRSAAQWRDLRFNGPSLGMFCSATTLSGSVALPFVISTGAQRSGEICGSTVPPWECSVQRLLSPEALPSPLSSRPERSAVERSAVQRSLPGNVLFSDYSLRKRCPPLCHLDRSAAQRRDLRFNGLSLGMFCSA